MPSATSIDTRLVLRIYAWVTIACGLFVFNWPGTLYATIRATHDLPGVPWGLDGLYRIIGAAIAGAGFIAVGLSRIENPASRHRALLWFAIAHVSFGAMFVGQSYAIFDRVVPRLVAWTPLCMGIVLLFIALTSAQAPRLSRPFRGLFAEANYGPVVVIRERGPLVMSALRSQYEEQIRQSARLEERTRLARDLHDAVKQQLFAIQTSAATAQERMPTDAAGANSALAQVRESARDAMTEMKALIEQLQSSPVENTGLVTSLQEQCDALALRTGAEVTFEAGTLPPSHSLPPGTQQALFRAAQEALSNIARHARATKVSVRLALTGDRLELAIRDNGAGFNPNELKPGMGLKNMGARVADVTGTMLFAPQPGGGTVVAFSIPCDINSAGDYAKRAWLWTAVVALMLVDISAGPGWDRPFNAIIATIASVTVARYVAAWWRTRRLPQAVAA